MLPSRTLTRVPISYPTKFLIRPFACHPDLLWVLLLSRDQLIAYFFHLSAYHVLPSCGPSYALEEFGLSKGTSYACDEKGCNTAESQYRCHQNACAQYILNTFF